MEISTIKIKPCGISSILLITFIRPGKDIAVNIYCEVRLLQLRLHIFQQFRIHIYDQSQDQIVLANFYLFLFLAEYCRP